MRPSNDTRHVAVVGITGIGKSTLVNVLSGEMRAKVANDANPCTSRPHRYDIEEEGFECSLWDTRGLNEALERDSTGPIIRFLQLLRVVPDAERELRTFLRGKNPQISLILFCIHAKKIQVDAQWKDYDKIYAKFCKRKVKVAVVVTEMDQITRGTNWRKICEDKAKNVAGEFLDARMVEAVPVFDRLEETRDCKSRILRLISESCPSR